MSSSFRVYIVTIFGKHEYDYAVDTAKSYGIENALKQYLDSDKKLNEFSWRSSDAPTLDDSFVYHFSLSEVIELNFSSYHDLAQAHTAFHLCNSVNRDEIRSEAFFVTQEILDQAR